MDPPSPAYDFKAGTVGCTAVGNGGVTADILWMGPTGGWIQLIDLWTPVVSGVGQCTIVEADGEVGCGEDCKK